MYMPAAMTEDSWIVRLVLLAIGVMVCIRTECTQLLGLR